jgi:hypothetical protein
MSGYKRLLLDTRPTEGDDVIYNVIVVVSPTCRRIVPGGVFSGAQALAEELRRLPWRAGRFP